MSAVEFVANSIPLSGLSLFMVFILIVLSTAIFIRRTSRPLPPGPRGFPLVGVLPLMGKQPHITVQKWWAEYGDLVSVYMGSRLVLIVNGVDAMKECFVRQADIFSGRPDNHFKRVTKGKGEYSE